VALGHDWPQVFQGPNARTIDVAVSLRHAGWRVNPMPQTTKPGPRSPRAKLSQRVRVRPYDPHDPEEVCVRQNLSRTGFDFETSLRHYFSGMGVGVTRNFAPGDLMNREEGGEVVRVERLNNGKWGVAIHVLISSVGW
jgi:hypothetical protein